MTSTITQPPRPPARLEAQLVRARQALALAVAAAPLAGEDAFSFTRISIHVSSVQALEAVADMWHVRPHWNPSGDQYTAEASRDGSEIEAVFCGPRVTAPETEATEDAPEASEPETDEPETAAAA